MGRSRATKPTRKQKILMQSAGLVPKKLAGTERNDRGIDRGKPWLRKDQEG